MKIVALLAALALVGCGTAPVAGPQNAPRDSVVEYLIASSASDFHSHPPGPVRVRNVRLGHVMTAAGDAQYLLCGELLPAQGAEWVPFATIKTSGYEQWIGGQAAGYCRSSSVIWDDDKGDLSSSLQSRLDSPR